MGDIKYYHWQYKYEMETFKKKERLYLKSKIDVLFKKGRKIKTHNLLVIWNYVDENQEYPVEILISAPKRIKRKAVDRNRIKRQLREIYRTEKGQLYQHLVNKEKKIVIALVLQEKKAVSSDVFKIDLKNALEQLMKNIS